MSTMLVPQDRFVQVRLLLKVCGIPLEETPTALYRVYSLFILSVNFYPFLQFIGAHKYLEGGEDILEFFIFEAVTTLIWVKAMVMYHNRRLMGSVIENLQKGFFKPNPERGGPEEERLMEACVALTNKQALIYWLVVTLTVIFALGDATYARVRSNDYRDWKFEYGRVTMFNTTYSPNYEIASLYQNLAWFPMAWTFAMSDLVVATVLAHLVFQLKILQNSIRRIASNSLKRMRKQERNVDAPIPPEMAIDTSTIPWKYLKPTMQNVVEHHLAIFDIARQIEDTFNRLVLLMILSGIVLIGSILYRLNGLHFGGMMCLMSEVALICYWGNEVSLESEKVLQACYGVNFFGADLRLQKALFLVMVRCKRPITITAGKFTVLSLGTFIWIARASYSYLMILRRMNAKEEHDFARQ